MTFRSIELQSISDILGVELLGKNVVVNALNLANRMLIGKNLTYIGHETYLKYLAQEEIVGVMISEEHFQLLDSNLKNSISFFVVDNPEKEFYNLHNYLYENTDFYISPSESVSIRGKNLIIHPTAVIDDGVTIQDNVIIGANAVIHTGTVVGSNVTINAGAVIGEQGFQVLYNADVPYLVKHVGGVKIGDNVSIGANCCIAKSLFDGYTEVGSSTKIDNLVSIAHNCKIGNNCVLTSGVIMTGSAILDDGVWLAPNAVVLNKLKVGRESLVGALSLVTKDIDKYTKTFGLPAVNKGTTTTKLAKKNNKKMQN
ncbi:DapH/DapD/GlmU-related protein [Shewanella sp. 30m-9]